MASKSQRNATRTHRRRAKERGLVRVEVQAPKQDAGLIRTLAETLREERKGQRASIHVGEGPDRSPGEHRFRHLRLGSAR